jgi:hypothetical protein
MATISRKIELVIFALVIFTGVFLVLRPVPLTRENSIALRAIVSKVTEGPEDNVILKLDNGRGIYFINHGLAKGLSLDSLQRELINREVTVLYLKPGPLAALSPVSDTRHITELSLNGRLIYTEL